MPGKNERRRIIMEKYILKSDDKFLHFECGGIVLWHNINPAALCAFDTREEAQEIIDEHELENTVVETVENFPETYFT
jgi:hypothetical protein